MLDHMRATTTALLAAADDLAHLAADAPALTPQVEAHLLQRAGDVWQHAVDLVRQIAVLTTPVDRPGDTIPTWAWDTHHTAVRLIGETVMRRDHTLAEVVAAREELALLTGELERLRTHHQRRIQALEAALTAQRGTPPEAA